MISKSDWLFFAGLVAIMLCCLAFALAGQHDGWKDGYEAGQSDAISGRFNYMVTYPPSGDPVWTRLDHPTTQPVIARGK
jgi:hypothetical protein